MIIVVIVRGISTANCPILLTPSPIDTRDVRMATVKEMLFEVTHVKNEIGFWGVISGFYSISMGKYKKEDLLSLVILRKSVCFLYGCNRDTIGKHHLRKPDVPAFRCFLFDRGVQDLLSLCLCVRIVSLALFVSAPYP